MSIDVVHVTNLPAEIIQHRIASHFPDIKVVSLNNEEEFIAAIGEIEALLAFRPPRGHWDKAGKLRLIQTVGAGVDAVLPAPDLSLDVKIANARGVHAVQMGEFAIAMMFYFAKDFPRLARQQKEREWQMFFPAKLSGATCGILGLGAIGEAIAERAAKLGMRVIATQRTPKSSEWVETIYPPEETAAVVEQSDYLVIVVPLTDDTRRLIDAPMMERFKTDAVLINLSRGGVVDEGVLAQALRERRLKGAAVDVFEEEPLPKDTPFWATPNLLITPHMAGASTDYIDNVVDILAENLRRLQTGETLHNEIDRDRGY